MLTPVYYNIILHSGKKLPFEIAIAQHLFVMRWGGKALLDLLSFCRKRTFFALNRSPLSPICTLLLFLLLIFKGIKHRQRSSTSRSKVYDSIFAPDSNEKMIYLYRLTYLAAFWEEMNKHSLLLTIENIMNVITKLRFPLCRQLLCN